ncbi:MAG TPA: crosslink repair DNA glycosylase YcaQ family protein [Paracoccaceae bacterium]|nr:crosslink repair DNA glycosylase YcaQ family protein [Paracoccaceae bacterium]
MSFLPNRLARRLALAGAGLSGGPEGVPGPARLQALIDRLGFVQVDSILTVARAHHLILFARDRSYRPKHLVRLLERDRSLFEHWTHDAAVIPVKLYPHWKPRFALAETRLRERWRGWQGPAFEAETEVLLARLRHEGPLGADDLERPDGHESGGLWNWTPQKAAIEFLWRTGRVAVARREGFRKIYDLAERVLPEAHAAAPPEPDRHLAWAAGTALERLGFGTAGEIAGFWGAVDPAAIRAWAKEAAEELAIEGADGSLRRVLALPGLAERAAAAPEPPAALRVLSPFDPVLHDRTRAAHLFGFDYRIEIFVPAARRKYGYYVFPLLEGDRFVGRIDMKVDRAAGLLRVSALWPEPGVKFGKARLARLEAELARLARFALCEGVEFADGWLRPPP